MREIHGVPALCHSREQAEQAEQVKARLAEWLKPRGLVFNEDRTRVVHLEEGCDFLGFTIRRYQGKLLIKPSREAVRRIRNRLRAEVRSLRGANVAAALQRHADGNVSPCECFPEFMVVNLYQSSTVDLWQSERFRRVRSILAETGMMPVCSKCVLLYLNGV
ncbi:SPASM domain-containing protein [Streptomyces antimycoticus]